MKRLLVLFSCIPLFIGCAHIAVSQAQKKMKKTFDSLMGCLEEEIVVRVGVPQNIQHIGNLKVYQYHHSYGTRTNAYANAAAYANPYSVSAFGNSSAWESYDEAEVVFRDGRAISWKGYVQR